MSTKYDFGAGPVPAHQHANGGGWVADSAYVSATAVIGSGARVAGGQVFDGVVLGGEIYGGRICGGRICGGRIFGGVVRGGRIFGGEISCGRIHAGEIHGGEIRGGGIYGGVVDATPLFVAASRHSIAESRDATGAVVWSIGCETHSLEHWLDHYAEIGARHRYSAAEVEEYRRWLAAIAAMRFAATETA